MQLIKVVIKIFITVLKFILVCCLMPFAFLLLYALWVLDGAVQYFKHLDKRRN